LTRPDQHTQSTKRHSARDWSDDAALNRESWTGINAKYTDGRAPQKWADEEVTWGLWGVPESGIGILGDLAGLDIVDLGCGTGYQSARFVRQGARPVGVDITPAQLDTARRMMAETGIEFPLVEADAGETGLPASSFDLAFSEYGASIWIDQERFTAEAARLLRPGGRFVFLCNSPLVILCSGTNEKVGETLVMPQFGMHRIEWPDGVEFCLPHGERIALLSRYGFEVERLVEVQAPENAETHGFYDYVNADWGRHWPVEEIWAARKRA
jgi:ubiquinone/menaquinone biosynthesis C-methylase UbiE